MTAEDSKVVMHRVAQAIAREVAILDAVLHSLRRPRVKVVSSLISKPNNY
jgi:hypothetical protein